MGRSKCPDDGSLDRCIHIIGVFKIMILGWIQVDRMMVVGLGMDVVVIFDIIEYRVLLLDRIKKGLSKALRYQKVGAGW